jgi:mono/diheme cytochrome c family protein
MSKPLLVFSSLLLTAFGVCCAEAQDTVNTVAPAAEFKIPALAASQINPVKPTAESRAHAKKVYGYECAVCHGEAGDGAGEMATHMKAKLPDFRDPSSLKARTDGELFYIIQNGKGEMEGEGQRLKPDDTWNLVNYLRTFAKLQASAGSGPGHAAL